jgi:hypothetical protein
VAIPFSSVEQESSFMENVYLITAAGAIALTAIYFLCVRKLNTAGKQVQPSHQPRDVQQ